MDENTMPNQAKSAVHKKKISKENATPLKVASVALLATSYYAPKDFMAPGARRIFVQVIGCAASFGLFVLEAAKEAVLEAAKEAEVNQQTPDQNASQQGEGPELASDQVEVGQKADQQGAVAKEAVAKETVDQGASEQGSASDSGVAAENNLVKRGLIGAGVLVGVIALFGASAWATVSFDRWAVRKLSKHGVKYPNSAWGAVSFVAGTAALVFDD
ncbi:hypothetical protein [Corynebacterium urogenitale]